MVQPYRNLSKRSKNMSGNPPKVEFKKRDPLGFLDMKTGIKVTKKGVIETPDDLYDKTRPEDFPKGIEKKVDTHRAKFAASVLAAASEASVGVFVGSKQLEEITGSAQGAYRGNSFKFRIARNKSFPMKGINDKRAFASITQAQSFKTLVKPAKDHLCDIAKGEVKY